MDQATTDGARSPNEDRKNRKPFARHVSAAADSLRETRKAWPGLSLYERFEEVVVVVLTGLIGLVIIAAMINLSFRIVLLVIFGLLDPAEHSVFQAVFGMIFTVLIALEFNHSILSVLHRQESIIQLRTVILIALLALARKFIILDASKTQPLTIIGLAAAVLALGAVYWLVRDQDRKVTQLTAESASPPRE
ncbi:phosphate-starvation-inducible PsiE family protein [Methylorubrum rhodesianum]